jgi:hypothetical protein
VSVQDYQRLDDLPLGIYVMLECRSCLGRSVAKQKYQPYKKGGEIMRKHLLIILLATVLTFGFVGQAAAAYYISWGYVGHQVYEDGRDFNRVQFELRDIDTEQPPPIDILVSAKLTDKYGATVPLSNLGYHSEYYLFGRYDSDTGQWNYDEQYTFGNYHTADIDVSLIVGTYNLLVTDIYGDEYDMDFEFNGLVNLPIISSSSFRLRLDPLLNLIWEWDIDDCYYLYLNPSLETQARAYILIYDQNDNQIGMLWVSLPTHLGRLFVPSDVLWKVLIAGKSWKFGIQLRDRNSNNKSYSNSLEIP